MVIYDGEKLVVSISKANYRQILKLAQECDGEYLSENCSFVFPPTRHVARELKSFGCTFDKSAEIFIRERTKPVLRSSLELPDTFYPFQKENINFMIGNKRNILLGDDCGTGKSVSLSGYLKYSENPFRALIVCPSTIKTNWSKEIKKWVGKDSVIVNGLTSYETDLADRVLNSDVVIINYDILAFENQEDKKVFKEMKTKFKELSEKFDKDPSPYLEDEMKALKFDIKNFKVGVQGWCDYLGKFNTIVIDECQYIESDKSIRTRAVQKICSEHNGKIICASATPFETQPSQLFTVANLLAPDIFPDKWKFLYRYCDPKKTRFGWTFNGLTHGGELRQLLLKFMIRHKMEDVLPELPEQTTSAIYIDVEPKDRALYDRMDNDYINVPSEDKSAYIAKLKQELSKAKLPSCIEWIEDYLSSGKKLVVSVFYKETFDILMNHFKDIAVGINGDTPQAKRDGFVEKFQTDDKIRLFVGQIKASGTGITLTSADTVVFLELGTTIGQHEQMSKRVKRIGQKSNHCEAIYLLLDNSIDDDRFPVLEARNANSQMIMNGKVEDKFCDLDTAIKLNWAKRHQA